MSKTKPILPSGWEIETFVLANLLSKDAKVLFIYNEDYDKLLQLKDSLNIDITIMNDDTAELEKARSFGFSIMFGNVNAGQLTELEAKSFDFVVAENVIQSARYPSDFLKDALKITDNLIVCNENRAHWKKRIKFLFFGSHYIRNPYDIVPDDKYAWFNKNPWSLSHKDILHLCNCQSLTMQKGVIIYKNGVLDNIYDLRSSPNFHADKIYYLITENATVKPLFKMDVPALS